MANETSSMPTVSSRELRAYLERLEQLEEENARLKAAASRPKSGHLLDEEITIGLHVAARVGTSAGAFVQAEVSNIYRPLNTGPAMYSLKRLDGGKKSLSLKTAEDIFPPDRATD